MDLVLRICDDLFLDTVWANLIPITAFAHPPDIASLNGSAILPVVDSKWSQIISFLPHPPLPPNILSPSITSCPATFSLEPLRLLSAWPRDYVPRQLLSLSVLTLVGVILLYFFIAGLSYTFIFNHEMMKHPRFLKNQIKMEIHSSLRAFPGMTLLTLPWFQAEVMGYSKLYDDVEQYGWWYLVASVPLCVLLFVVSAQTDLKSRR
jgi:lathosterol oxidase